MPRFALLEHDHPTTHWDFFLEDGPTLRSWRLHAPPQPGSSIVAEAAPAHRLLYLDYEGPVSGDRGTVWRRACGTFTWELDTATRVEVRLTGSLSGRLVLWQVESQWWLRWEPDDHLR